MSDSEEAPSSRISTAQSLPFRVDSERPKKVVVDRNDVRFA